MCTTNNDVLFRRRSRYPTEKWKRSIISGGWEEVEARGKEAELDRFISLGLLKSLSARGLFYMQSIGDDDELPFYSLYPCTLGGSIGFAFEIEWP